MYQKILNFIKYNNAFTIIFSIILFGFGISFAASPDVRDSIYASTESVISVDNKMIVSADLNNFNFNLRISSITEDKKNYYAAYSYQTLTIEDDIWQNKEIEKTLTINKETLDGKDLGLYVAKELGENINYELSYLQRVQKLEKEKGESQKIVAIQYSGLVGKLLNPKEKVIEGYNPVIPEVVPEIPATAESGQASVIVSTPYSQPSPEATAGKAEPQKNSTPEPVVSPQTGPISEPTSTTTTTTTTITTISSTPTPTATSTPVSKPATPTPEEMVDEKLIQTVVKELLQDQVTSTPPQTELIPESTSTPASTTTSTPVSGSATPAPETVPEPKQ